MYNPINRIALFVAYISNTLLRHKLSAATVENTMRNALSAIRARYNSIVATLSAGVYAFRVSLSERLVQAGFRLIDAGNTCAPRGYLPASALIMEGIPCPTTPEGSFECVPCAVPTPVFIEQVPFIMDETSNALVTRFNQSVANELSAALPVASIFLPPHVRKVRVGKDKGKVKQRIDYKPIRPSDTLPGQRYWYKDGKKWVEMLAPDHAAPVAEVG